MRLLLDSCVPSRAAEALRLTNHDVIWVGERQIDPGDEAILEEAFLESRVLVTLDRDFGSWSSFSDGRIGGSCGSSTFERANWRLLFNRFWKAIRWTWKPQPSSLWNPAVFESALPTLGESFS